MQNIVLDLDNTLIFTPDQYNWYSYLEKCKKTDGLEKKIFSYEFSNVRNKSGNIIKYTTIVRPHCNDFLEYCFNRFDNVCIWSAGDREYVSMIVSNLFSIKKPDIVFTRDEIIGRTKPLQYIIDNIGSESMLLENTFMIDDLIGNFEKNPNNGILIPSYKPRKSRKGILADDNTLLKLISWFDSETVKKATDIRKLDKNNIFS